MTWYWDSVQAVGAKNVFRAGTGVGLVGSVRSDSRRTHHPRQSLIGRIGPHLPINFSAIPELVCDFS